MEGGHDDPVTGRADKVTGSEGEAHGPGVRIYRALVRIVFPRGYRTLCGDQMIEVFREQLEAAQALGQVGRLWRATALDLLSSGARVRWGWIRGHYTAWSLTGADRSPTGVLLLALRVELAMTVRRLLRRPTHALIAIGIQTLGLAAAITVVTYSESFNAPFPGADPDRLVRVMVSEPDAPYLDLSYLDFLDYAATAASFEGMAAAQPFYAASVRHETLTEVAHVEAVSGAFFQVARVEMALGRPLLAEDDEEGAPPVAIISYAWWQSRYGSDPAVLGRTIFLNNRPFTVVGVAGARFLGSTADVRPQVWIPFAPFRDRYVGWDQQARNRDVPLVRVFARTAEGVSDRSASEELEVIAALLDSRHPGREQARRPHLESATWIDPRSRSTEEGSRRVMGFAALAFLLLVCANVANLQLSSFVRRRREVAMHAALGASRRRLFGRALAEPMSLSAVAAAIAVALAVPLSTRLGAYFDRPSVWGADVGREMTLEPRIVLIAVGLALATGFLAGVLPSLEASARHLPRRLRTEGMRTLAGHGRGALGAHGALITTQVAVSVLLLVVAGLVTQTLANVRGTDPGFRYRGLVVSHLSTSSTRLAPSERERWFHRLTEEIEREPWVESATVSQAAPLTGHPAAAWQVEGAAELQQLTLAPVHAGFFGTMGIELEEGRVFSAADTLGATDVAVINRSMAERFFPDGAAVGRTLSWPGADGPGRRFEVVGVVASTRVQSFMAAPQPAVYVPYRQHTYPTGSALILRTTIDPGSAVPLMEQWVRDFEPFAAIVNVAPYEEVVRGASYAERMRAELFTTLALLGLILAAAGIFSVVALTVARRTREIGLRKAVGASAPELSLLIVRQALAPVVVGLAIGVAASFAASGLVRGLLVGVEPTNPVALLSGCGVLLFTTAAAAYLPARRARTMDPMSALGSD